jgi:hypothetical protein
MKHTVLLLLSFLVVLSCNNDDDNQNGSTDSEAVGTWELIEIYSDPGDGSGDFVAVESDKSIQFNANGTLSSNANLCLVFSQPGEMSTGLYSEEDGSFTITDCETMPVTAYYELIDSNLIVSYFCIEGCQEKYEKVE